MTAPSSSRTHGTHDLLKTMCPVLDPRYVDALTLYSIEESDNVKDYHHHTLACTALYVLWCSSVVSVVVLGIAVIPAQVLSHLQMI